ncbi:6423_t:CDS:2, partial [Cetraspora pellucida]
MPDKLLSLLSKQYNDLLNSVFKKPNISPDVFEVLLGGTIDFVRTDPRILIELLPAADELFLTELCDHLEEHLIDLTVRSSIKQNFVLSHRIANQHRFEKFSSLCETILNQDPGALFSASDFADIEHDVLLSLFRDCNSQFREIDLWNKLLEWSIVNTPSLPPDISQWTTDDISTFGVLAKPFIQYINLIFISPDDFFHKIRPFRRIFDVEDYIQILEYHTFAQLREKTLFNKPIQPILNSKIISAQHMALISKWITAFKDDSNLAGSTPTNNSPPPSYKFKLLLRGSRDGFTPKMFHAYCDQKGPTVTIVHTTKKKIIGGYNPLSWHSRFITHSMENYEQTKESFIFSLDQKLASKSIVSKVKDDKYAIYQRIYAGPCFGNGGDLIIKEKTGFCYKKSYEKCIIQEGESNEFLIDDYE